MALGLRNLHSMEMSDDEKLDRIIGPDMPTPDYADGLQFSLGRDDLTKICDGEATPGATLRFAAFGTAIGVYQDRTSGARIEVELTEMAGEDGKFAPLDNPAAICLCSPEMEKIDLAEECEKGDTIHLVGTARVERTADSQWSEGGMVTLQIIELAVEDESEESRNG